MLLFQVAGRELILLLQRCRRPAVSDDVESSAAGEDSDDDEDDDDDEDNLMFHDPVAAPSPPVVAVPGILMSISNSGYSFIIGFTGKKPRGGVKYNNPNHLGPTLTR